MGDQDLLTKFYNIENLVSVDIEMSTADWDKQDAFYIKQPLGYEIFRRAGIPYFRCNFAKVTISDPVALKEKQLLLQGVYVNSEPPRESFLRNNFKNDQGNLYETEAWFDLTKDSLAKKFDSGGYSKFKDQQDMKVAIDQIDKTNDQGFDAVNKIIDVEQILKVLAMSALINHGDGYPNNTFVYNDVVAKENPTAENGVIKLKIIPSGNDVILKPMDSFKVKNVGFSADGWKSPTKLTYLIIKNSNQNAMLRKICQDCTADFATKLEGHLNYVEKMKVVLKQTSIWTSDLDSKITGVASVLKSIPSGMQSVVIQ